MARSREENSDRGSGSSSSSKFPNHLYKPSKISPKFFRALESLEQPLGLFGIFFGVYSLWPKVPESTRIYNQYNLVSAVGLKRLIKRTVGCGHVCSKNWAIRIKSGQLNVIRPNRA